MAIFFNKIDEKVKYLKQKENRGELSPEVYIRFKRLKSSGSLSRARFDRNVAKIIDELIELDKKANQKSDFEIFEEQLNLEGDTVEKINSALRYITTNIDIKFSNVRFDKAFLDQNEIAKTLATYHNPFTIGIAENGNKINVSLSDMMIPDGKYTIATVINCLKNLINEDIHDVATRITKTGVEFNDAYSMASDAMRDAMVYLEYLEECICEFILNASSNNEKYQEKVGFTLNPAFERLISEAKECINRFVKTPSGSIILENAIKKNEIVDENGQVKEGKLGEWFNLIKREGSILFIKDFNVYDDTMLEKAIKSAQKTINYVGTNIENKFANVKFDKEFMNKFQNRISNTPIDGEFIIGLDDNGNEIKVTLDDMTVPNGKYTICEVIKKLKATSNVDENELAIKLIANGKNIRDIPDIVYEMRRKVQTIYPYLEWLVNSYIISLATKDEQYQKRVGFVSNPVFYRLIEDTNSVLDKYITTTGAGREIKELAKERKILDDYERVSDDMLGEWYYTNVIEGYNLVAKRHQDENEFHDQTKR